MPNNLRLTLVSTQATVHLKISKTPQEPMKAPGSPPQGSPHAEVAAGTDPRLEATQEVTPVLYEGRHLNQLPNTLSLNLILTYKPCTISNVSPSEGFSCLVV